MNVLITGVAGFMGSRLADWILANVREAQITGIDDLSCGYLENIPQEVRFQRRRLGSTLRFLGSYDYIFHFAASAYEGLSPWIRVRNYHDNLLATAEVINHVIDYPCKRLIFASSMAVYGDQEPPFAEGLPRRPCDPYGVAKTASEMDLEILGEQHGVDWCIVRPHNVYGSGQSLWQRYRNVLGLWMRQHLEGKPLTVFGDGSQVRAFSCIDDILPCIWRAATEPAASHQIINLGGSVPIPILKAAFAFRQVIGGCEIVHLDPRHEVHEAWSTHGKSAALLGFEHRTSLEDGLSAMWGWAQMEWARWPERRQPSDVLRIEAHNGIHPSWTAAPP
jgi:UDP-glucose 4-epimerase